MDLKQPHTPSSCPQWTQEWDRMAFLITGARTVKTAGLGLSEIIPGSSQPPTPQGPAIAVAAWSEPHQPSPSPASAHGMESLPTSPNMSAIKATWKSEGPLGHSEQSTDKCQGMTAMSHGQLLSRICRGLEQETKKRNLFGSKNAELRACHLAWVPTAQSPHH